MTFFGFTLNHLTKQLWQRDRQNRKRSKRGGQYCIAGTPNQQSCEIMSFTPGIHMHQFPTDPCVRAQWVQFVHRHRHDYKDLTLKKEKKMSVVKSVMEEYKIEMSVFKSNRRANARFCYPSIT